MRYAYIPCLSTLMACIPLVAQNSSTVKSAQVISVESSEAEIDGLYVLPIGDEPFTAKIQGWVVSEPQLATPPPLAVDQPESFSPLHGAVERDQPWPGRRFIRVLARNAAGEIYYDDRNSVPKQLFPVPQTSDVYIGLPQPVVSTHAFAAFYIINLGNHTRTMCLPAVKSCRIEALPKYSPAGPPGEGSLPRATETVVKSLGTKNMDGLEVEGRLETTTLVARAFGNAKPLVDQKQVWHSDQLGLAFFVSAKIPGTRQFVRRKSRKWFKNNRTRDISKYPRAIPCSTTAWSQRNERV